MMDCNAPAGLLDTPASSDADSRELIEAWHQHQRLHYAVTPRFAPTSSPQQLTIAGQLRRDYPNLYVQSHLAENPQEIAWIKSIYPQARNYVDVYDRYGLLGERCVYGHGIHLNDEEVARLAQTKTGIA